MVKNGGQANSAETFYGLRKRAKAARLEHPRRSKITENWCFIANLTLFSLHTGCQFGYLLETALSSL
jgi:hypothetical protein